MSSAINLLLSMNRNQNIRILDLALTNYDSNYTTSPAPPINELDIHHPPFQIVFHNRSYLLDSINLVDKLSFLTNFEKCIVEIGVVDWAHYTALVGCYNFVQMFASSSKT